MGSPSRQQSFRRKKMTKQLTGKRDDTPLHSAARAGNLELVKDLMMGVEDEEGLRELLSKQNQAGETALFVAAEYGYVDVVNEMIMYHEPETAAIRAKNGYDALHIAAKQGDVVHQFWQIVKRLLEVAETDTKAINKSGETALDTAEKMGNSDVALVLVEHGVLSGRTIRPPNPVRELKQTVSDIKHGVHTQLEHTHQTRKRVQGIAKKLSKLHAEGLNNAINSTTVVAVLIATVAFAAIFTVPGQYIDSEDLSPGLTLGEAYIASQLPFMIFFIFDSVALFISLAVVVVQTSLVVIESKAKKKMMMIINKLMWLCCVLISVAFLALSFIVVGDQEKWLAIGVTIIGTVILSGTLGIMLYWVILHRMEAKKIRNIRRASLTRSRSWSVSHVSDVDLLNNEYKRMYAI